MRAGCGASSQATDDADFAKLATGASPIDHGTTLTEITHDYTGAARTGAPDIGAIEAEGQP